MTLNRLRSTTFLLMFIISLFFIVACSDEKTSTDGAKGGQWKQKSTRKAGSTKATPITVINPKRDDASAYYTTTTALEPKSDAKINARSSGVVRQLFHEEGDDVERGAVLLQLEDDEQKLRALQAKQKLISAEKEYRRLSKMRKAGVVPANEYESAEIAFQTAKTDKDIADLALSQTKIIAPFTGRVVTRNIDLGAYVTQGELLFRMMVIKPLLLRVYLPASRVGIVARDDKVELNIDNVTQSLVGIVDLVSPIVDPNTGTIKITIRLDEYPNQVRPGDFTEVKVITAKHVNTLMIPTVAVIEERESRFVFVEQDGQAKRSDVEIGFVVDSYTEITAGLEESDKVIIKGQRNLNDGVSVVVIK